LATAGSNAITLRMAHGGSQLSLLSVPTLSSYRALVLLKAFCRRNLTGICSHLLLSRTSFHFQGGETEVQNPRSPAANWQQRWERNLVLSLLPGTSQPGHEASRPAGVRLRLRWRLDAAIPWASPRTPVCRARVRYSCGQPAALPPGSRTTGVIPPRAGWLSFRGCLCKVSECQTVMISVPD